MVTCHAPASVLTTFTMDCKVKHKVFYKMARRLGWLALGVHMCILGMCTLFTQIYTVILLVLSTWALCSDFDFDIGRKVLPPKDTSEFPVRNTVIPFNNMWEVVKTDHPKKKRDPKVQEPLKWDRRQVAWARIKPTEQQEKLMKRWNLLPYEDNKDWWKAYNELKLELHPSKANEEKAPRTPPAQTRPPLAPTLSHQPLFQMPATPGTYASSIGGTLTPSASRCSSPSFLSPVDTAGQGSVSSV
jgi:hypothetical protein